MKARSWLAVAAAATFLGVVSMGAQAAPAGSATTDLKATARTGTAVEPAHYYRRRHHRHHHHGFYFGAPYFGYYAPSYRRYYDPGIHFYYGHRRHRHHRHWHRHRHW